MRRSEKESDSKKLLYSFSNSFLIDKLIEAKATLENKSKSAVLEELITRELLPESKEARYVIEYQLYGKDGGIGKALKALFSTNAEGINWNSKYDNFEPILEFAKSESSLYNQTILTGEESELPHMKRQFEKVIEQLTDENQKKFAKEIYEELDNEPQFTRLGNVYLILQNDWEKLKSLSVTYRLLADMVSLEKDHWRKSKEAEAELLEIIKAVSVEWK